MEGKSVNIQLLEPQFVSSALVIQEPVSMETSQTWTAATADSQQSAFPFVPRYNVYIPERHSRFEFRLVDGRLMVFIISNYDAKKVSVQFEPL